MLSFGGEDAVHIAGFAEMNHRGVAAVETEIRNPHRDVTEGFPRRIERARAATASVAALLDST